MTERQRQAEWHLTSVAVPFIRVIATVVSAIAQLVNTHTLLVVTLELPKAALIFHWNSNTHSTQSCFSLKKLPFMYPSPLSNTTLGLFFIHNTYHILPHHTCPILSHNTCPILLYMFPVLQHICPVLPHNTCPILLRNICNVLLHSTCPILLHNTCPVLQSNSCPPTQYLFHPPTKYFALI